MLRPPSSTLFPYTTLFRSRQSGAIETDSYAAMLDILQVLACQPVPAGPRLTVIGKDRKSTRLNSSHVASSYAVFCLKKKKFNRTQLITNGMFIKDNNNKYK